jgi:putative ABC transport system substrate-binding protein
MRRRTLLTLLAAATLARPRVGRAQASPMRTVGVLRVNRPDIGEAFLEPFGQDMKELGWEEGRNLRLIVRWAELRNERLPGLAELAAEKVDLIVAFGDPGIRAAQQATSVIPIVGLADDLVRGGLAASMARPGANTTGISILSADLDAKRLELLRECVPSARRIAALADPSTVSTREALVAAARQLGVDLVAFEAQSHDEIAAALDAIVASRVAGVNVLASPILNLDRDFIIKRMSEMHLPAIYQAPEAAVAGGLIGYGPSFRLAYRQIASLADKILRGTRPSDLPIEQPAKFDLVINLRTASVLGISVPPALLLRADEVIE